MVRHRGSDKNRSFSREPGARDTTSHKALGHLSPHMHFASYAPLGQEQSPLASPFVGTPIQLR